MRTPPSGDAGERPLYGTSTPRNRSANAEMTLPTAEQLVETASAMLPRIAERTAQADRDRMVPREIVAEMNEAGLFRVLQPKCWGGYEMEPNVFVDIVEQLGRGCMSTAWIYGIQAAQPFLLALFDERAAGDVWGENPHALMCSTFQPTTDVKVVDGGYVVSGRWSYLSGCHYSDWVGVGGILPPDSPTPGERIFFLLPRKDWEIVDIWDVAGLRGTGSNDVTAQEVFVPEYRTLKSSDVFNCRGPGLEVNTAPLYRIPFQQVFVHGATNTAVGALRGLFERFLEHAATRVAVSGARTAEDPVAQLLCAETANTLDEITLVRRRNLGRMMDQVRGGQMPSLMDRIQFKFQTAYAVERCSLLAARLFKASGTSAIFNRAPFARILNDIAAGRQHIACQYEASGRSWGAPMLGLPAKPEFMI